MVRVLARGPIARRTNPCGRYMRQLAGLGEAARQDQVLWQDRLRQGNNSGPSKVQVATRKQWFVA